jgi:predicted acyltransferase
MCSGLWGRLLWILGLLAGYWLIVALVDPPAGFSATVIGTEGLLHEWIDVSVLGDHLYFQRPDPLGLLSTLPAIATTMMGVLAGSWLRARCDPVEKVVGMFLVANVLLVAGSVMGYWFPINKKLWTSSYAVFTAGMALHLLAMCYWLVDVKRYRRWGLPFLVFGTNAIAVYFASSLFARILNLWKLSFMDGQHVSVKRWVFENVFATGAGPFAGSLGYAVSYVVFWGLLTSWLYRRRIFIKV